MSSRGGNPALWGALAAVAVHAALGATLASVSPRSWQTRPSTVELEVVETPPPVIEEQEPKPEPPAPPRPRVVVQRFLPKPPPVTALPPPNQEPPPTPPPEQAPPTFGVSLDSTVTGDSSVAVPIGNTVATTDRTPRKPGPVAALPAAPEAPSFSPVSEAYVAEFPKVVTDIKADYPDEARRLGFEGQVLMRVGIDRKGSVRTVRVIKKAGYGMDEAATRAMWKFKFTPARTRDGEAVDFQITYTYTFRAEG